MPAPQPVKDMEDMQAAHAAYNNCSEQLANTLSAARAGDRRTKEQLAGIAGINKLCADALDRYLVAFEKYYGYSA